MKTYTFAPKDAPVRDHMAGLVKALEMFARGSDHDAATRKTLREKGRATERARTYRDVAAMIRDSNSYGE